MLMKLLRRIKTSDICIDVSLDFYEVRRVLILHIIRQCGINPRCMLGPHIRLKIITLSHSPVR
jgi:hypothetical protein